MSPIDPENPSAPAGKARKYAQPERERRFLLAEMPPGAIARTAEITDNYLSGTRLRLRHAEVTRDIRFSGGRLAASTREDLLLALSRNGIRLA